MATAHLVRAIMGALVLASVLPAHSLTAQQYITLRRQSGWDSRVTLALCEANPTQAAGRTVEMSGTVSGLIEREDGIRFMLRLPDGRSTLMPAPAGDARLVSTVNNQTLRVLARVSPAGASTLGGLSYVPLGLAYEADVAALERELAEEAAAAARASASPAGGAPRVTVAPPTRGSTSRGGARPGTANRPGTGLSNLAVRSLSSTAQAIYPHYRAFIGNHNRRLTETELDQITVSLLYYSERHKVDPRLVVAMIVAESDFRPRITSHAGAMGLGQIMPDEARSHGLTDPYDPIQNIRASVNLLRMKLNLYWEPGSREGQYTDNQIIKALAAYNAGAGAVKKYGGVPPYRETQGYVKRIIKLYRELCGT